MENNIGKRIAELRKQQKITQTELADQLNISDKTVSKWESGKGDPSLEMLELLSNKFDCSIDYLVKGYDKEFYVRSNDDISKKCFELLKAKIGEERFNEFSENYSYKGIKKNAFNFETSNKELFDKYSNAPDDDPVFEHLLTISMNVTKDINGFRIKFIDEN